MAKAKVDYKSNIGQLTALLKKEPENPPPIQEVRPVVATKTEDQVRVSGFWVPASLARRLKVHSAESDKSITQISIEAYELYFAQLEK